MDDQSHNCQEIEQFTHTDKLIVSYPIVEWKVKDLEGRPLGYCTVKEWVQATNRINSTAKILPIRLGKTVQLAASKGLYPPTFAPRRYVEPTPYVALVPGGCVWGSEGAVLSPNLRLLYDAAHNMPAPPQNHNVFHRWQEQECLHFGGTAAVITCWDPQNHFHWLYDIVARFHLLRRSGIQIDRYIINDNMHPYFHEVLPLLDIPQSKVVLTHDHFYYSATALVVPSLTTRLDYSKWTVEFLRRTLMQPGMKAGHPRRRIYVSRRDAGFRRIVNEPDVIHLLQQFGFQTYSLGRMTLQEQLELFSSAEAIVAPHGAGLANLAFARPGTIMVELFASTYVPAMYWKISNHAKLDYYTLINHVPLRQNDPRCDDIAVNVDELRELLFKSGLSMGEN